MKSVNLLLLLFLSFLTVTASAQKPKTALVDVQHVFRNYHKTISAQEQINDNRAKIQKDDVQVQQTLGAVQGQLAQMAEQIKNTPVESTEREPLIAEYRLKIDQARKLQSDRQVISQQQTGMLSQKMVQRADSILKEIHNIIKTKSKELGYDIVLDKSGLNSSQVPFALFVKDGVDITETILTELNKSTGK